MSRIGRNPIQIPIGTTVSTGDMVITVKGPKGELSFEHHPDIAVVIKDNQIEFTPVNTSKKTPALWGLTRALISNMVQGVNEGFEKKLELVGVGYRAKLDNPQLLSLSVGYSHPVLYDIPEGISISVENTKDLTISGIDKHLVGQVAAQIRKVRPPEPYKGKGIKYIDEVILRKAGKTGKV